MPNYSLASLDAEFTRYQNDETGETKEELGLMFRCPNCRAYGSVYFNPVPKAFEGKPVWDRTGETLETLTLTPSVMMRDHFHSWIRNGNLCVDSQFSCEPYLENNG